MSPQVPPPAPQGAPNYANPWQTPAQSGKAIASLVLGIVSIMCCVGPFTGIPAIVFGFIARRDVARSEGQLDGSGLAVAGIVTGMIGTFGTLVYLAVYASTIFMATRAPTTYPTYTPPAYTYTPPPSAGVKAVQLKPSDGALGTQLIHQTTSAALAGKRVMVMTVSASCAACAEITSTFSDPWMVSTLANVIVVKVDVNDFASDLGVLGFDKGKNLPWFFLIDGAGRASASMSADEWDDNTASNIAPAMNRFLHKSTAIPTIPSAPVLEDPF